MTTVVCDGSVMISDSMLSDNGLKSITQKIFKINGCCIGFAGSYSEGLLFCEWYRDRRKRKPVLEDIEIMVLTPKGVVFYDESLIAMRSENKFNAIGTGRDYAIGAYSAGASTRETVEIACKHDIYSSLPLKEISID